jgi:hypothetical protein
MGCEGETWLSSGSRQDPMVGSRGITESKHNPLFNFKPLAQILSLTFVSELK